MAKTGRIIALEEHFWIPNLRDRYTGHHRARPGTPARKLDRKLDDLGELRIREMDEAGIDLQVLSHLQPGTQVFDPQTAIVLAREANDRLHEAILAYPDRFAGFASLPTPAPQESANELERTVTKYGFKGAMVNGLTNGSFLDEKRFWCIFERAQALDVPIYLHPAIPHAAVIEAYYNDYQHNEYPIMMGAMWGFNVETATQCIRLILSGVFEKYPKLKFIIGHMGEMLPFALWRCNFVHSHLTGRRDFADLFREHFYITTSGNFSHPALVCSLMELGVEKVLFSVDWPFNSNVEGVQFIESAPISEADKQKIFHENVARVLRL